MTRENQRILKLQYDRIRTMVFYELPFNDQKLRSGIKSMLENNLPFVDRVICDATNNTPDLIDMCGPLVARLEWKHEHENFYMDLRFSGRKEIKWRFKPKRNLNRVRNRASELLGLYM